MTDAYIKSMLERIQKDCKEIREMISATDEVYEGLLKSLAGLQEMTNKEDEPSYVKSAKALCLANEPDYPENETAMVGRHILHMFTHPDSGNHLGWLSVRDYDDKEIETIFVYEKKVS